MRLTAREQAAVKLSANQVFGPTAVVRIFGSRLDDRRRGGDIDLHVHVAVCESSSAAAARLRRLLNERVGELEYDIVVAVGEHLLSSIDRKAQSEGVVL